MLEICCIHDTYSSNSVPILQETTKKQHIANPPAELSVDSPDSIKFVTSPTIEFLVMEGIQGGWSLRPWKERSSWSHWRHHFGPLHASPARVAILIAHVMRKEVPEKRRFWSTQPPWARLKIWQHGIINHVHHLYLTLDDTCPHQDRLASQKHAAEEG